MNLNDISRDGRGNINKYFYERSLPYKQSIDNNSNNNNNRINSKFNEHNYLLDTKSSSSLIKNDYKQGE